MSVTIRVAGRSLDGQVLSILLTQRLFEPWTCRASVQLSADSDAPDFVRKTLGKPAEVGLSTDSPAFPGVVSAVRVDGSVVELGLRGQLSKLDGVRRSRGFENITPGSLVERLVQDAGLSLQSKPADAGATRPFVRQYDETDRALLVRTCAEQGWICFEDGAGICVTNDLSGAASVEMALNEVMPRAGSVEIQPLVWRHGGSAAPFDPASRVDSKSKDLDASKLTDFATSAARDMFDDATHDAHTAEPLLLEELRSRLTARSRRHGAHLVRIRGTTDRRDLRVGLVAQLAKGEDGESLVDERLAIVETSFSYSTAARMTCAFVAVPLGTIGGPASASFPVARGIALAEVIGVDDEKALGRVRIRFVGDQSETWARVLTSAAHKDLWSCATPRVDSIVAVGFFDDRPDLPVVLGSLFDSRHRPSFITPESRNGSNEVVLFATEDGSEARYQVGGDGSRVLRLSLADGKALLELSNGPSGSLARIAADRVEIAGKTFEARFDADAKVTIGGALDVVVKSLKTVSSGVLEFLGLHIKLN